MRKREYEALKRRITQQWQSHDPGFDRTMDDAVQACTDPEWDGITAMLDHLHEQVRAAQQAPSGHGRPRTAEQC